MPTIENDKKVKAKLLQHDILVAKGIRESKEQYRKIIKAGIAKWVQGLQSGIIEIKSVNDLRTLIELDIELQKDNFSGGGDM